MKVRLGIFLLVIFVVLLCSCEKNNITFEENNDKEILETLRQEIMSYVIPKVIYIAPKNKDKLASKYREYLLKVLQSIFTEDRIRDLIVTIKLDNINLEYFDEEIPIDSNAYRIIVSVNIDGKYEFKYDEKHRFIILPDGSRKREYIPISDNELIKTEAIIQDIIGYANIIVTNIPFDRAGQFIAEDNAYFKQQKTKTVILFLLGCFVIICFVLGIIFSIKYYIRKRSGNMSDIIFK